MKIIFILLLIGCGITFLFFLFSSKNAVKAYETAIYKDSVYNQELYSNQICVANSDISYDLFQTEDELGAVGLFNLQNNETFYADNLHEKMYPASITKILTAYIALKYGNLEDIVTVGENAMNVPWDSSKAYLQLGDQLTLEDLIYSMLLASGNDSAVAIAEHISGSEKEFVTLMNEEAQKLGAFHTHFVNAHGYHDDNHYTTAYDLYLILNACVKNEKFVEIITDSSHQVQITQSDGSLRKMTWTQTNAFIDGTYKIPENISLIGGKTGTTLKAGACLILYVQDAELNPYISIIMNAPSKPDLYEDMQLLISTIN